MGDKFQTAWKTEGLSVFIEQMHQHRGVRASPQGPISVPRGVTEESESVSNVSAERQQEPLAVPGCSGAFEMGVLTTWAGWAHPSVSQMTRDTKLQISVSPNTKEYGA